MTNIKLELEVGYHLCCQLPAPEQSLSFLRPQLCHSRCVSDDVLLNLLRVIHSLVRVGGLHALYHGI